jgi:hypothetical protein
MGTRISVGAAAIVAILVPGPDYADAPQRTTLEPGVLWHFEAGG